MSRFFRTAAILALPCCAIAQVHITVSPRRAPLTVTEKQQFVATVLNTDDKQVIWRVDGIVGGSSSSGTVTTAGLYTPPHTASQHTVSAQSHADSSKQANATVWVTDYPGMTNWHGDKYRSGVNYQERALTATTVNKNTFGKLFSFPVDGQIYAQPLHVANLSIGGHKRNVVFVATEHDSVYAFDADGRTMAPLWKRSFLSDDVTTLHKASDALIAPEIGITSTPVIDLATKTLFVEVLTKESDTVVHRLHALSITNGAEKFAGPVKVSGTYNGITFAGSHHLGRSALLLLQGTVFVTYTSFGDRLPYQGWIFAYTANGTGALHQAGAFATASSAASIWMSGAGPAADPQGNLYLMTANGRFDLNSGGESAGNTFLKLKYANNAFTIADYFTPSDQEYLNDNDYDLGSGGVSLPPTQSGGDSPELAIGGGKEGVIYLVDRHNMGQFNPLHDDVVQEITIGSPEPDSPIFFTSASWTSFVYFGVVNEQLQAFQFDDGLLGTTPTSHSRHMFAYPGTTPMISALGSHNGILWAIDNAKYAGGTPDGDVNDSGPAVLHAYNAHNLAQELYNSAQAGTCGTAIKFTSPTIANGHVYVGGANSLTVYGLLP